MEGSEGVGSLEVEEGGCWVRWGWEWGGVEGRGGEVLYFMGDSLERKSRREGSRSRRGSVEEVEGVLFQNQPIGKEG